LAPSTIIEGKGSPPACLIAYNEKI
jgi:hypothetical protein